MRLDDYMQELNKISVLSQEEEAALWRAFKERGDMQARRRLIESYQPLVFKQALPYRGYDGIMDIIQEGTVGLIEAAERYEPARGVAFSLFAVHRIRGRMRDFLRREHEADIACMDGGAAEDSMGASLKEALADAAFETDEVSRTVDCAFLTPTSFKRDGRYAIFPESRLIVQSLLQRWNAFCPEIPLEEEDLASKLADHAPIVRYDLHTASFSLERQRITGFRGRFALHFGGTDSMRRILALLASFAPFAGIGIKTALGMGAVTSALQYRTSSIGE